MLSDPNVVKHFRGALDRIVLWSIAVSKYNVVYHCGSLLVSENLLSGIRNCDLGLDCSGTDVVFLIRLTV